MTDDLSGFACQNSACPDFAKHGRNNLKVDSRYGKDSRYRMLLCRTCKQRFSERKGTSYFGAQLTAEKIGLIMDCLKDGKSVRTIARIVGVNRNTVVRYSRLRQQSGDGQFGDGKPDDGKPDDGKPGTWP